MVVRTEECKRRREDDLFLGAEAVHLPKSTVYCYELTLCSIPGLLHHVAKATYQFLVTLAFVIVVSLQYIFAPNIRLYNHFLKRLL